MTDFLDEKVMEHRRLMFRSMKRKNTSVKTQEWAARMGIKHIHSLGWGCHEGCTDGLTPPVHERGKKRPIVIRRSQTTPLEKSLRGKRRRQATFESKRRMERELSNGGH